MLIPKFVEVPSRSVPFMVLASADFTPKTTAGYTGQNDTVKIWLRLFFSLIPAAFIFSGFVMLWWYPITRSNHEA